MTTHLLVFANSNLHGAAWQALLGNQPGISVQGESNVQYSQVIWEQLRTYDAVEVTSYTDLQERNYSS